MPIFAICQYKFLKYSLTFYKIFRATHTNKIQNRNTILSYSANVFVELNCDVVELMALSCVNVYDGLTSRNNV